MGDGLKQERVVAAPGPVGDTLLFLSLPMLGPSPPRQAVFDMRRQRTADEEYVVNEIKGFTKENPGFNKSKLVTPVLVGAAVLLLLLFLFGGIRPLRHAVESEYHGKEKNALVIIDSEWFLIPQSNSKQMHYVTGGKGDPLFVLIHGQSRRYQDSRHWATHYDLFDTLGTFCAVDLLGHGGSVPGKHDDSRLSIWEQAEYTSRLIDSDFSSHRDIVLVARGWGVNVALELGKRLGSRLRAQIYIAPEVDDLVWQAIPSYVITTPMLLVWAKDDPVSDFSESENFMNLFTNVEAFFVDQVADVGIHKLVANTPENMRVFEFQNNVHDFLADKKLINA